MSKAKLLLTYLLLVGFPLLVLLAILRAGERLTPPQSVGGAWRFDADFSALASGACRDLLSSVRQPFLNISQSGPSLTLTLNNPEHTTLAGTLQDSRVDVAAAPADRSGDSGNCLDRHEIQLQADVAKEAGRRVLIGTLSVPGCANCAPVPFRAERPNSSQSEGR
jgi:hypothetical protein